MAKMCDVIETEVKDAVWKSKLELSARDEAVRQG